MEIATPGHIYDGRPLCMPMLYAGAYPADDPAATPSVATVGPAMDPEALTQHRHPHSGHPALVVTLEGDAQQLITDETRLAHRGSCQTCAPVWAEYRRRAQAAPEGAFITALLDTASGPRIVADAAGS